jgi:hypothetical protein
MGWYFQVIAQRPMLRLDFQADLGRSAQKRADLLRLRSYQSQCSLQPIFWRPRGSIRPTAPSHNQFQQSARPRLDLFNRKLGCAELS